MILTFMPFKSVTAVLICSLYLFISTSIGTYYVTSSFLIPSTWKTLNDLFIGSVLILSFFTNSLSILVWVHPESTSACNYNFFLFAVLMFFYTFHSLFLLFFWFKITYQFWELLFIEVLCTMSTLDLCQNPPCYSNHLSLKDKWSHNEQSSLMGYQVKSGGLQENSTRSPRCIDPLYILQAPSPCYNNIYLALKSMPLPHVHYSSTMLLP